MMGGNHAACGAAAWVAVTSTGSHAFGWYPLEPAGVVIGGLVTAGAALICDSDHRRSSIAYALPPVTNVLAFLIGKVSGGHRNGTHSIIGVVVFILLAALAASWQPVIRGHQVALGAGLLCMFLVAIALKTLEVFPRRSVLANWFFGLLAAVIVCFLAPVQGPWLPLAMGIGVTAHILGDLTTVGGVPLFWPLKFGPPKSWNMPFWRTSGFISIPILGTAGSWREKVVIVPIAAYALFGFGLAAWKLVQTGPLSGLLPYVNVS
ncbi:metal-dependent hydrolase [Arthrobacter roseus]|uniref:metal-dependent hydrolase n=1 Tax=Arthrobacter roseus TaxID=136274 RepID=UPI001962F0E9|nr:metal-dependent hydrolase [Arthrobacter roseus]